MGETVSPKCKYLEMPQDLRDRLIRLHGASKQYKRQAKNYKPSNTEEIEYTEVFQELKMVAIRSEEVKRKAQIELSNLEDAREYIKALSESGKDRRKEELQEMVVRELNKGEEKLSQAEEKLRILLSREKDENILQIIQKSLNCLAEKIEHLK
ncbi:hypothetical protein NEFER03_0573 [Nematocida sp. LUAm3]|nr:hypothetical protein NEFER03_0573 [Nematocida sp. LUAm3]KAI5175540.1 hypothetical protein NEFER02_1446 [Nematocida sp. LUAm2]KAI5178430.1 hypothetical protein NEFER01_1577 [Nematocida sp. LUAm1]